MLFLIPTLTGGGSERVVITLLRHFDRGRFELALGVVDSRDAAFLRDVPEDVAFVDLSCRRVLFAIPRIIRLAWAMRPDVILSTLGHLNLAIAMVSPLLPHRTRLVGRESTIPSQSLQQHSAPHLWSWMYRLFYRRLDRVICQSRAMRDDLVAQSFVPMGKTALIPNPVDVEHVSRMAKRRDVAVCPARQGEIRLVAAGRLAFEKGFDLLIEAVALCAELPIQLIVLGKGPLRGDLERLARRLGVTARVQFAGFQENPYPWLANADGFVSSSRYEGSPNAVLEALACGTPVIATPAPGGTREILEGNEACVIADDVSAAALCRAIREWVRRGSGRVSCAAVWPHHVDRVVECYQRELLALAAESPSGEAA